jgi:Domain of unknown function (DUF4249)
MKQKIYLSSVSTLLALIVMGCKPSTDEIELPVELDKMVLNGFFSPAEPFSLSVVSLQYPLSSVPNEPIKTAVIELLEEGILVETLQYDDRQKRYISPKNFIPAEGKRYAVKASAPGYQTAQSEPDRVLPLPDFRRIRLVDTVINDIKTARIELVNTNPLQPYLTEFAFLPGTISGQRYTFKLQGDFTCLNQEGYSGVGMNIKSLLCKSTPMLILFFDGQSYDPVALKTKAVMVSVGFASKAFYDYHTTYQSQALSGGSIFSSPSSITSNVRGGYGLVAAHSIRRLELQF